ncbi:hypothetical protein ADK96_37355 [Streptomyces sp. IGB124]|nr:hypothetical protein ADK96_37355 [Streptomyces sp. IGB124]
MQRCGTWPTGSAGAAPAGATTSTARSSSPSPCSGSWWRPSPRLAPAAAPLRSRRSSCGTRPPPNVTPAGHRVAVSWCASTSGATTHFSRSSSTRRSRRTRRSTSPSCGPCSPTPRAGWRTPSFS